MKTASLVFACLMSFASSTANAQVHDRSRVSGPVQPAPWVYVGGLHHASTAAESYARGYADLVQAQGQYDLLASHAMINLAEARRLETENRVARTEAYFRMREINRSHRNGDPAVRSSQYTLTSHNRVTHHGKESGPQPFDPREGRVAWPKVLKDDVFKSYRAEVEQIVRKQAGVVAVSESDRSTLVEASQNIVSELRNRIREYSPQDYVDAKRFLATLRPSPGASW
jgi:hypothetical protein